MIERPLVRVPPEAAGKVSFQGSDFCADSYFGIRSVLFIDNKDSVFCIPFYSCSA